MKRFPSRCASAIQIVRPLASITETTAIAVRNASKCDQVAANELIHIFDEIRREYCLDALKKRIEERLRYKKSCTILEGDLARVWLDF